MEIDLQIVRQIFDDLLSNRMSREQANCWAYSVIQHDEAGDLTYSSVAEKRKVWAGVMYLYGVDMMRSPGKYLHTDEDIKLAMEDKLGGSEDALKLKQTPESDLDP